MYSADQDVGHDRETVALHQSGEQDVPISAL